MAAATRSRAWEIACAVGFAVLGLSVAASPAGTSLSLAALLLLALLRPRAWRADRPWREPAVAAGLMLLAFIALHTLVASGPVREAFAAINRYHELLFIALLLPLLRQPRLRTVLLYALLAGALLWALAMWVAWLMPAVGGSLHAKRISAGLVFAIASYAALMLSTRAARPWPLRALAAFLAVTTLVPLDGRTGHVLIVVLAACAAWVGSPPRWRVIASLVVPLVVIAVALTAPGVRNRIQETVAGSGAPHADGPQSSTAIRIELLRLASDIARKNAVAGAGYANYAKEQEAAAIARYSQDPARAGFLRGHWIKADNPHNEFANQLIGGGVVALALFLAWLVLLLRTATRMGGVHGAALAGATVAFAVSALLNSSLMDFVEGHVFMAWVALLLAEGRYGQVRAQAAPRT